MHAQPRCGAAMIGCGAMLLALVGCGSSNTAAQQPLPQDTSVRSDPAQSRSAGDKPPSNGPPVHYHSAGAKQAEGSVEGIDVTITSLGKTTLRPGGDPIRFNVTLVNTTTTDYAQIGLVVSLGHCSCNATGSGLMPAGTMSMWDPGTNAWLTVPYVVEGTGADFLATPVGAAFVLTHGQSVNYRFRLGLQANQAFSVVDGTSSIDATMTDAANSTSVGPSPTTSLPVTVRAQ